MREDADGDALNRRSFARPEVVGVYARMSGLTAPERVLFDRHLRPGMDILDLGVGGGRTTGPLRSLGGRYVGVDYVPEMIDAARRNHPGADLRVGDASDLTAFGDGDFDAVVFSFNGIDYLQPREKRLQCLVECSRVLKTGGVFIFSSHNARFVAGRFHTKGRGLRWCRSFGGGCYRAGSLAARRLTRTALWRGRGYVRDPAHGGLSGYETVPYRVRADVAATGLELIEVIPSTGRDRHWSITTPWYYYACRKGPLS